MANAHGDSDEPDELATSACNKQENASPFGFPVGLGKKSSSKVPDVTTSQEIAAHPQESWNERTFPRY
jgi:hypothetical protein